MSKNNEKKSPTLSENTKAFEKLVFDADFDDAMNTFGVIANTLETSTEAFGSQLTVLTELAEQEATIFAAAFTNMLTHKGFRLTKNFFVKLAKYKRVISQIFEISGYRGTKHFIDRFSVKKEDGATTIAGADIPKLFCCLSINAMTIPLAELLLRQKTDISWVLAKAFLTEQLVWEPEAEKVRSLLLSKGALWTEVPMEMAAVNNAGPIYMGCSYADAPHKHDIKKTVNSQVRNLLKTKDVKHVDVAVPRRAVKKKPTLIVAAELYTSVHAMHRCYGPAIRSLKDKFKLIYMSGTDKFDDKLSYMFDQVDKTKFSADNPKLFFDKMKSYRPDIIYYPAVGMRLMSIYGSNLRIAPIQMMTYGHPATTHSKYIDYSLVVEGLVGDEGTIADKILYWHEVARYEQRHDAAVLNADIRENPTAVKLAVPAWSRKITPKFLATCKEIERKSSKPVEFYFFPNGVGSLFQAVKSRLERMLPTATVFPRTNYNAYLSKLSECDVFLSSFPFGATNGILDACPLGLPIVNMKGDEMHAMNDSEMVSHMPQPDWLSTDDEGDYIRAVLRLIENDEERVEISKALADFDFDEVMMVSPDGTCPSFGRAVRFAYEYHEELQVSGQKSFSTQEVVTKLGEKAA